MSFGSQISFADRWFLYFMLSNFSLRSTTRAYPTEQQPCCFLTFQAVNSLDFLIIIRLMRHLYNRLEPTKLMCRLICNQPELCIRILIRSLPIFINRYEFRITDPDTLCCRIAYPTEHQSCCFFSFQAANSLDCLIVTRLMRHLYNRFEPTKLMCRLICNLPELNIRIYQSACFLF